MEKPKDILSAKMKDETIRVNSIPVSITSKTKTPNTISSSREIRPWHVLFFQSNSRKEVLLLTRSSSLELVFLNDKSGFPVFTP